MKKARGPEEVLRRDPEADQPAGPESAGRARIDGTETDTEGHMMLPDPSAGRHVAQAREREIQRKLQSREATAQPRRPFFKRGK
jgi:hypothetical protein